MGVGGGVRGLGEGGAGGYPIRLLNLRLQWERRRRASSSCCLRRTFFPNFLHCHCRILCSSSNSSSSSGSSSSGSSSSSISSSSKSCRVLSFLLTHPGGNKSRLASTILLASNFLQRNLFSHQLRRRRRRWVALVIRGVRTDTVLQLIGKADSAASPQRVL